MPRPYLLSIVPGSLPWWLSGEESTCQCRKHGFNPWIRKIPWGRKWQPTLVFLPGKSHGQRSLAGHSPWGLKESDTTEHVSFFSVSRIRHQYFENSQGERPVFNFFSPLTCVLYPLPKIQLSHKDSHLWTRNSSNPNSADTAALVTNPPPHPHYWRDNQREENFQLVGGGGCEVDFPAWWRVGRSGCHRWLGCSRLPAAYLTHTCWA